MRCKPTWLPLGKKGFKQWPLAPDSKYALEALTLDKMVTLYFDGSPRAAIGAFIFGRWVMGAKANVKTRHGAGVNIPRQQSDCCGYVCHRTPSPQRQHGLLGASFLQSESRSPQCTSALNWYILVDQREGFGFSQSQRNYLFKFWWELARWFYHHTKNPNAPRLNQIKSWYGNTWIQIHPARYDLASSLNRLYCLAQLCAQ